MKVEEISEKSNIHGKRNIGFKYIGSTTAVFFSNLAQNWQA